MGVRNVSQFWADLRTNDQVWLEKQIMPEFHAFSTSGFKYQFSPEIDYKLSSKY